MYAQNRLGEKCRKQEPDTGLTLHWLNLDNVQVTVLRNSTNQATANLLNIAVWTSLILELVQNKVNTSPCTKMHQVYACECIIYTS